MLCPKCRTEEMNTKAFQQIEIDRCTYCKGIFLDYGELQELVHKKVATSADSLRYSALSDAMDAAQAHCPRCDLPMVPRQVAGVVKVDFCTSCGGVFVDQGELATIQLSLA